MSVRIDSLIDNLLKEDVYIDNVDDDLEYYNERISELTQQITYYKQYSVTATENDKKIIRKEILELSLRVAEYTKLRDNLTPKQRVSCDSELMFHFDD